MHKQDSRCTLTLIRGKTLAALMASALLACASGASAIPLTDVAPMLVVSGANISVTAETVDGSLTQTGELRATEGGVVSTTAFSTSDAAPTDTITLTDTGDGLGANIDLNALAVDDEYEFKLGIELDFANNSTTDTVEITLLVAFDGAIAIEGDNAFAFLELGVMRDGSVPLFESLLELDSFNGTSGPSSDASSANFVISLTPGAASQVTANLSWEGGVFNDGASLIDADFYLSIADIRSFTPPPITPTVAEPSTVLLIGLSLVVTALLRRRRFSI